MLKSLVFGVGTFLLPTFWLRAERRIYIICT